MSYGVGLDLLILYAAKKEVRMNHEGKEISGFCIQLDGRGNWEMRGDAKGEWQQLAWPRDICC